MEQQKVESVHSLSLAQVAAALGVTARAVSQRAAREGWSMAAREGRAKLFSVDNLPLDVRAVIEARQAEVDAARAAAHLEIAAPKASAPSFSASEIDLAKLKASLVRLFRKATAGKKSSRKKIKRQRAFAEAYNIGLMGPYPELFAKLGELSWKTISRWDLVLERSGDDPLALADRRGKHRYNKTSVTQDHAEVLVNLFLAQNALPKSEVVRAARNILENKGVPCPQCDRTFSNYLSRVEIEHQDKVVFCRRGEKALNDQLIPHVVRDWEALDVGDVLIADGHVCNFTAIDPATGKERRFSLVCWYDGRSNYVPGFDLTLSENTESIALSLFRAIVSLGKLPKVVILDNGRAFRGKFFSQIADFEQTALPGAFQALGITPIFSRPYRAESKPIERFFGSFAELERKSPSYVGSSIEDKPARLKRNERLHKAIHANATGGHVPTLLEAYRASADWLDKEYHHRPQTGHLAGSCPAEIFGHGRGPGFSDEELARIRLLLSPVLVRQVRRDGLQLPGDKTWFYDPALYALAGQRVHVRYDWARREKVWVYSERGEFLCAAESRCKVHPAASVLGDETDQAELRRQLAEAGALKKQTVGPIRQMVETEVIPIEVARRSAAGFETGEIPGSPPRKLLPFTQVDEPAEDAPAITEAERRQQELELGRYLQQCKEAQAALRELYEYQETGPWLEDIHGEDGLWDAIRELDDFNKFRELRRLKSRWSDFPEDLRWFEDSYQRTEDYRQHAGYFANDFEKLRCVWIRRNEPFARMKSEPMIEWQGSSSRWVD